jgi:hypothetical protein
MVCIVITVEVVMALSELHAQKISIVLNSLLIHHHKE